MAETRVGGTRPAETGNEEKTSPAHISIAAQMKLNRPLQYQPGSP